MKINIRDIPSRGLELSESLEAETLGISPEDLKCISPLKIKVTVSRVEGTVWAHTEVQGHYSDFCARCLAEVECNRSQKFDLDYAIEEGLETIDLRDDIRQEVLLSYPTKILCTVNCKGLCPSCGVNLNKENCKCKKTSIDKSQG